MESLINGGAEQYSGDSFHKKSFLSHVFSSAEESKAEILNVVQYAIMAVIPVIILNKLIQRFIPEAEPDKSSLELLAEIFIQLIVMFCGIIVIHRIITYFPTYSGFKYENLTLTNVIVAFLIIVLSIQTKLGIKVNILADQVMELWNGPSNEKVDAKKNMRKRESMLGSKHTPSQADFLQDNSSSTQMTIFPPLPSSTSSSPSDSYNYMKPSQNTSANVSDYSMMNAGPQPANFMGNVFGSAF
jgi:hypothetical protein